MIKTEKPLFFAGAGVSFLAHFCAVGYRTLNVLATRVEKLAEVKGIKS